MSPLFFELVKPTCGIVKEPFGFLGFVRFFGCNMGKLRHAVLAAAVEGRGVPGQPPCVEEVFPIDTRPDFLYGEFEFPPFARHLRDGRRVMCPVGCESLCVGFGIGEEGFLSGFDRTAQLFLFPVQFPQKRFPGLLVEPLCGHDGNLCGVACVNHGAAVSGCDFHRRMQFRGGGTTYHEGDFQPGFFHRFGNVAHLFERRGDESAHADDVDLLAEGCFDDDFGRHHYSEVDDVVIVAAEDDGNDVFPDVMHIAFDRGQEEFSVFPTALFLHGNIRLQDSDRLFHGAGGFHDLGQEHFSFTEELSYAVHSVHEGAFDDFHGTAVDGQSLVQVGIKTVADTFDKGVFEPFIERHQVAWVTLPGLWLLLGGLTFM